MVVQKKESRTVPYRVDKSFLSVVDSYRAAIEKAEGIRMSRTQATARMAKKLSIEKKWW